MYRLLWDEGLYMLPRGVATVLLMKYRPKRDLMIIRFAPIRKLSIVRLYIRHI